MEHTIFEPPHPSPRRSPGLAAAALLLFFSTAFFAATTRELELWETAYAEA